MNTYLVKVEIKNPVVLVSLARISFSYEGEDFGDYDWFWPDWHEICNEGQVWSFKQFPEVWVWQMN